MPKKQRKTVKDILTWKDLGEMLLSFFAVLGVLASPTLIPTGFKDAGLWLVVASMVIIYVSIYAIIIIKGQEVDAMKQSFYHLLSAIIITTVCTIVAGIFYGFIYEKTIEEILVSPLPVAFSVGLLWSGIIDGLKGDK